MPLDASAYQQLIIGQVGDDAAGTLASQITTLWTANDNQTSVPVQALYVRRDAIDLMLARARQGADFTDPNGTEVKLDQLFEHLLKMRQAVQADIDRAVAAGLVTAAGSGAVGELTKTTPIAVDYPGQSDPSGRVYRGDPLRPRRRRP